MLWTSWLRPLMITIIGQKRWPTSRFLFESLLLPQGGLELTGDRRGKQP